MTLIEVTVAMAVLSLVVLALGASLRGISQSALRVDQRVDAVDEMRVGVGFLRELFARVSVVRAAGPGPQLLFDAHPDGLAWVAVMPARFGASGRHAFRLRAEPAIDGTLSLVLRYAPWPADAVAFPEWSTADSRVLAVDLETFNLGYGGDGVAQGWQSGWSEKDRLPGRVRIDLSTAQGAWPPVILPLRTPLAPSASFAIGGSPR